MGATDLLPRFTVIYTRPGVSYKTSRNRATFHVRLNLDDTVENTIKHICYSLGLSYCPKSKKLYLAKASLERHLELNATLKDCGVKEGAEFVLQGYNALKMVSYEIKVIVKITEDITRQERVRVQNTTTVFELQHKLQDLTGVHVDHQVLTYKGNPISGKNKRVQRTVELYKGTTESCQLVLTQREPIATERQPNIVVKKKEQDLKDASVQCGSPFRPGSSQEQNSDTPSSDDLKDGASFHGPQKSKFTTAIRQPRTQRYSGNLAANVTSRSASPCTSRKTHDPPIQYHRPDTKLRRKVDDLVVKELLGHISVPNAVIPNAELQSIADYIIKWEPLVACLHISETEKVVIQQDYAHSYMEQKYQLLLKWKQKQGNQATWGELLSSLQCYGLNTLAIQVTEISMRNHA